MRFFRLRRTPESDEEEAPKSAAEADTPTEGEAPAPEGGLLAEIGAEADAEMEAEQEAPETEGGSPQGDDPLDPDLLDIFRAAKDEVQESTLASELDDISTQDLLSDLVGVSHRLHAMPRAQAQPGQDQKYHP